MAVKLTEVERVRMGGRPPTGVMEAYDLVLRGHEERSRTTREGNTEARRLFAKAIDLDPGYAAAYLGLSWTYLQSWQFLWTADRESLARARELAEKAGALNDNLAGACHVLGQVYLWMKEHDRALAQAQRGIALAPNDGTATRRWPSPRLVGQGEESLAMIRRAMRLNPRYRYFRPGPRNPSTERRPDSTRSPSSSSESQASFPHAYRAVCSASWGGSRKPAGRGKAS
jgi:tetratricopeptide (TPR) repeat protein